MRWSVVAVTALLAFPLLAGFGSSQETAWMSDDADDHAMQTPVGPVPDAIMDRYANMDLHGLELGETEDALEFTWTVASMEPHGPGTLADTVIHGIHFHYGQIEYGVEFARFYGDGTLQGVAVSESYVDSANFGTWTGFGFLARMEALDPVVDEAAGVISVSVPRELIRDQDGAPLLKDRSLTGFWMETEAPYIEVSNAFSGETGTDTISQGDRMPNVGTGPDWVLQEGAGQVGHIILGSERPFRASNGEATTFLFEVDVTNFESFVDTVTLRAEEVPDQWTITLPDQDIRMEGEETVRVPVLATVPFRHEHGSTDSFTLTSSSRYDPTALGSVILGVHYMDPPQPAGHHDLLYLHNAGQSCDAYMNTLQEDPADTGEPIDGCFTGGGALDSRFEYQFVLGPELRMGLDFDLDRQGTLALSVQSPLPYPGARMSGTLYHISYEEESFSGFSFFNSDWMPLAHSDTVSVEAGLGAVAEAELTFTPTVDADYIPFEPNTELVLELEYTMDISALALIYPGIVLSSQLSPDILPGALLQLPLNEFHDDVDQYFSAASGIDLAPLSDQERLVNPGESVVFRVNAENFGSEASSFRLDVVGSNVEWVEVLGDTTIRLAPGEQRELAIAVQPPATALDGDLVDVTLQATKTDNENVRSLIRFLAEVDTDSDHLDESADAASTDAALQSKDAPTLPLAVLLGALLLVRRRL